MVQPYDTSTTGYEILDAYQGRIEQVSLHRWKFDMWVFVELPIIIAGATAPQSPQGKRAKKYGSPSPHYSM
jgi:hypothetical protein